MGRAISDLQKACDMGYEVRVQGIADGFTKEIGR